MIAKQEDYKKFEPYLKSDSRNREVDHLNNRVKVYEIGEANNSRNPELVKEFKEEMRVLHKYSKLEKENVLELYEKQGLQKAVSVARDANIDCTVNKLSSQSNVLGLRENLKGREYVEAIAKDEQIMKYVDVALSKGKTFDRFAVKNTDLLDYANQRDINKNLEGFRSDLQGKKLFKDNIESLQRFGKPQDLRDGLVMFKDKGINSFSRHTNTVCSNNITDSINRDFSNIIRDKNLELVTTSRCRDKAEYLIAISKDEQIMKHIEPKSDIGKAIQNQQDIQNEKTNNYDFER